MDLQQRLRKGFWLTARVVIVVKEEKVSSGGWQLEGKVRRKSPHKVEGLEGEAI